MHTGANLHLVLQSVFLDFWCCIWQKQMLLRIDELSLLSVVGNRSLPLSQWWCGVQGAVTMTPAARFQLSFLNLFFWLFYFFKNIPTCRDQKCSFIAKQWIFIIITTASYQHSGPFPAFIIVPGILWIRVLPCSSIRPCLDPLTLSPK